MFYYNTITTKHMVTDLEWARESFRPLPFGGKKGRLTKAQRDGFALEKKVTKRLEKELKKEYPTGCYIDSKKVWEYKDKRGIGLCETDIVIRLPDFILIIECKLTQTNKAFQELEGLYIPVLEKVYKLPVFGLQCVKNPLEDASVKQILYIKEFIKNPTMNRAVWVIL